MKKIRLFFLALSALVAVLSVNAQPIVPFQMVNNSDFTDDEIYVALIGRQNDRAVWMNFKENNVSGAGVYPVNDSYNTMHKTSGDWGYADIFVPLSSIADKTIYIGDISAARIFYAFRSPMYIHFFADGGYAGADLQNPSDPNAGIRWEIIEFSNADNGLWVNTTRVDAFQYPMGVELWGAAGANNSYLKAGDLLSHDEVVAKWQQQLGGDSDFSACLREVITFDNFGAIIEQPTKLQSFKEGGTSQNYYQAYIDAVWDYFSSHTLTCNQGERGVWTGTIANGVLTMTSDFNGGTTAKIYGKPTTQDIIEGKGRLAEGNENDKALQAQFCGAMTRGVVQLVDHQQDWGNAADFYVNRGYNVYNKYAWFFHQTDVSHNGKTYGFAYDDTFDQSSTLVTSIPQSVRISIGGFKNTQSGEEPDTPPVVVPDDPDEPAESGPASGSGTSTSASGVQVRYDYSFRYAAGKLAVTFDVTNKNEFVGLVSELTDVTSGKIYTETATPGIITQVLDGYQPGQTVTVKMKWMFLGGDAFSQEHSYTIPASSAVQESEAVEISLWPNPATSVINVQGAGDNPAYVIYDLTGVPVMAGEGNSISLSSISKGYYFLQVRDGVYKFLKR